MQTVEEKVSIGELIKDVAIYVRKSRGDLETDLIKHKTTMINICKKEGWRYVLYEEIGTGSSIESRPKMKELLGDLDNELYDAVVVMEFDRLSRGDEEDQGAIKKAFLRNNVFIIECSPFRILNLYDDTDMQVIDFKGFLARQEYKQITKRLNRGKKIGAKMGNWTNGIPPMPYNYDPHKKGLTIDDEKYKMYRQWIEWLFNGWSVNKIAKEMNRIKYPTPRSKYSKQKNSKWHGTTIANILKSETGLGKIITNKTQWNKYKKQKINIPKEKWVIVENCHEPVKTEEEHEKIIEIINNNRKDKTKYKKEKINPFSGLIKCYNCERTLQIQKRPNEKYSVRNCKYCNIQGGDISFLENMFKDILHQFYYKIDDIIDELLKNQSNVIDIESQVNEFNTLINKKEIEIKRIQDGYKVGIYTIDEAQKEIVPIKKEISLLYEQKTSLKNKLKEISTIDPEQFKLKYLNALEKINQVQDNKEKNKFYKSIFKSVYWDRHGDDLNIYIELKQGLD